MADTVIRHTLACGGRFGPTAARGIGPDCDGDVAAPVDERHQARFGVRHHDWDKLSAGRGSFRSTQQVPQPSFESAAQVLGLPGWDLWHCPSETSGARVEGTINQERIGAPSPLSESLCLSSAS